MYFVKNKDVFKRFCQLQVHESYFFFHGFVIEPLFDLVLQQNLFSICGTINLPKKNVDLFIYNLMQFVFPSFQIHFVFIDRTAISY